MSKLRESAATLRQEANRLESIAIGSRYTTAKDVIQRYAPPECRITTEDAVADYALGIRDYEVKKHVVAMASQRIARRIAENVDFVSQAVLPRDGLYQPGHRADILFRAEILAFTPRQLENLIEEAMRVGRESA